MTDIEELSCDLLIIGGGAAGCMAAVEVAKRIREGCVVTIACDRGDRYFAPMRWEKHYEW